VKKSSVSAFIDAVVSEHGVLGDWLREVVNAAAPVFEAGGGVGAGIASFDFSGPRPAFGEVAFVGDAHLEAAGRTMEAQDTEFLRHAMKPFRVTLLSRQFGRDSMVGLPYWEKIYGRFENALGMMSSTGPFTLSTLVEKRSVKSSLWAEFRTMQRYLSAALAKRIPAGSEDRAEAVIDAQGNVVHCESMAAQGSRNLLRAGAKALERARTSRLSDEEGDAIWDELLRGGWGVVEHIESDGKRLLLLRRRQHSSMELTRAEEAVLNHASTKASSKEIARALGLSTSTVSEHLASGLEKLGFRSRVELLHAFPRRATLRSPELNTELPVSGPVRRASR
jgi:DNA-binding CsgD family transcriptional regulator